MQTINLTFHTARHMTPRQWLYRLRYFLRSKLPAPALKLPKAAPCTPIPTACAHPQEANLPMADKLLHNEFPTVSQLTVRFDGAIDWDMPQSSYRLACFNLNSFSWLQTLSDAYAATGNRAYLEKGLSLIRLWQHGCGARVRGDKWNAYTLSKRLLHQIDFLSCHAGDALSDYVPFLAAQAKVLSRSIEFHLGANHVLREATALMYCGAFLRDETLYRRGKRILLAEFEKQFLSDGGHYERSVSYHVEALQQCYEALWLMRRRNDPSFEGFRRRLQKPYAFLNAMLRCDGTIPLANDAATDYPLDASDFLSTAAYLYDPPPPRAVPGSYSRRWALTEEKQPISWETPALFQATGFLSHHFSLGKTCHSLFLDAGDNGPDCNLGHAHADTLNLLWTTDSGEIFADSGVYTYAPGAQRDACRATAAHNTVEVDGVNSCEVWGAFRTARRGHAKVEAFSCHGDRLTLTASHDGYRKMLSDPVTHRRTLSVDKAAGRFTVTDTLTGRREAHRGTLRFHLAPGCAARLTDSHTVLLAEKYTLTCSCSLTLEPCFMAKEFGIYRESLCITARFPICQTATVTTNVTL